MPPYYQPMQMPMQIPMQMPMHPSMHMPQQSENLPQKPNEGSYPSQYQLNKPTGNLRWHQ